jgi:hypothetical protein
MYTEYSVVCGLVADNGSQRQPLKEIIHLLEDTSWVFNIFTKTFCALCSKSEIPIDFSIFVVSSEHEDLLWILQFQRKEQAKYFQTLRPSVNIVTEEEVIKTCNVPTFARSFPNVEEPHQVMIISVNVSEDFDRRFEVTFNQDGLGCKNLLNLCNQIEDLLFLN